MKQITKEETAMEILKRRKHILLLLIVLFFAGAFIPSHKADAKKSSFITNEKYIGTYGYKGKGSFETGWYDLIINKISPSGKIRFALERAGRNGSPIYATSPLTATIKGNKANFTYDEDGWGNKGKGTIVFKKDGTLRLVVKETVHAEWNRSSLAISKSIFKKVSNKHKIYTN